MMKQFGKLAALFGLAALAAAPVCAADLQREAAVAESAQDVRATLVRECSKGPAQKICFEQKLRESITEQKGELLSSLTTDEFNRETCRTNAAAHAQAEFYFVIDGKDTAFVAKRLGWMNKDIRAASHACG